MAVDGLVAILVAYAVCCALPVESHSHAHPRSHAAGAHSTIADYVENFVAGVAVGSVGVMAAGRGKCQRGKPLFAGASSTTAASQSRVHAEGRAEVEPSDTL